MRTLIASARLRGSGIGSPVLAVAGRSRMKRPISRAKKGLPPETL
jgi:hypothetical protein